MPQRLLNISTALQGFCTNGHSKKCIRLCLKRAGMVTIVHYSSERAKDEVVRFNSQNPTQPPGTTLCDQIGRQEKYFAGCCTLILLSVQPVCVFQYHWMLLCYLIATQRQQVAMSNPALQYNSQYAMWKEEKTLFFFFFFFFFFWNFFSKILKNTKFFIFPKLLKTQ